MEENRIKILLDKYFSHTCTEEEILELNTWYERLGADNNKALPDKVIMHQNKYIDEKFNILSRMIDEHSTGSTKRIFDKRTTGSSKHIFLKIAAVLLIFIGARLFVYLYNLSGRKVLITTNTKVGTPGTNGAILTLANGQQVVLDSAKGSIAVQGNTQVLNKAGQLSYHSVDDDKSEVVYNTLSTPRGRQYTVILPDGTKAMLNAASSIKYPTVFNGNVREVEVAGEVYFEVVHNASSPFTVKSGSTIIRDIGTHFDIINYPDEATTKTTLLEGAVTVETNNTSKRLNPGEQSILKGNGDFDVKQLADADDVIAWTRGIINFNSVDIATLLQQLSRWYNIDIVYKSDIPQGHITGGGITRNTDLQLIITALNSAGVHCQMQGGQLVISK